MIRDLLVQQRKRMLGRWTEAVIAAYPAGSAPFLEAEKDRFRNPVGFTTTAGLEKIYDGLLTGGADVGAEQAIEEIIRIRAVQQFSPSEAVGFIMPLKELIRDMVASTAAESPLPASKELLAEFANLEATLDRWTLLAVDCYVACREAVFRASVKEARAGGMMGAAVMRRKTP